MNLFGGHLDYNGGPVLPTAIDRGTFVAIRPRQDGEIRMASRFAEVQGSFKAAELPVSPRGEWFDYPLGVLLALIRLEDSMAAKLAGGFDVLFGGNLPVGAGLSSSASICVGTTFALDALPHTPRLVRCWDVFQLVLMWGRIAVRSPKRAHYCIRWRTRRCLDRRWQTIARVRVYG